MIRITVVTVNGNGVRKQIEVSAETRQIAVRLAGHQLKADERVLSTIVTTDGPLATADLLSQ